MSKKATSKPRAAGKTDSVETGETPTRYEVRVKRSKGEEFTPYSGIHPTGVKFSDDVGFTDDGDIADELEAKGFDVAEVKAVSVAEQQTPANQE